MPTLLKKGLALMLCWFVSSDLYALVILQYHHIDTETPFSTSTSPDRFTEHLALIEASGARVVRLEDAITRVAKLETENEIGPEPDAPAENEAFQVAITFDDAFISIFRTAFPLLKARGWPFTIFVAPDLVETSAQYLTWDHLREMQRAGATIANHSLGHEHLLRLKGRQTDDDWMKRVSDNTREAERQLTMQLGGNRPLLYALPYGEYQPLIIERLHEMGYTIFGQQSGATSGSYETPKVHPRFPMGGPYSALESFRTKLSSRPFPIPHRLLDPLLGHAETRPSLSLHLPQSLTRTHGINCFGPSGALPIEPVGEGQYLIQTPAMLPTGRSRYNCTLKASDGRFYWYSQMWMRKLANNTWWEEP